MWFGLYDRGKIGGGKGGSSGFEHVFVGEWKGTKVSGMSIFVYLIKNKLIIY